VQLVGEKDRDFGGSPPSTVEKYRLYGTDLGSPLDRGRGEDLYFLFGDAWTDDGHGNPAIFEPDPHNPDPDANARRPPYDRGPPYNADPIGKAPREATAESIRRNPRDYELDFFRVGDRYATLEVPGVNLLTNKVPTGGVSTPGGDYVFVTGPPFPPRPQDNAARSWVARWSDRSQTKLEPPYEFSTGHFANFLAPVAGYGAGAPPGHPTEGAVVWLWGTGYPNRESSVRLAYAPLRGINDRNSWQFFSGTSFMGQPRWSPDETHAARLFESSSVGEFSVAWNEPLGKWLMLYACPDPRGILCRWADDPWGPWSSGTIIFDPWLDHGYGHFMHVPDGDYHVSGDQPPDNHLSDLTRQHDWGGEYAPLMVPRYALGSHGKTTIRYTMSLWNPYTVVLMETQLRLWTLRDTVNSLRHVTAHLLGGRNRTDSGLTGLRGARERTPRTFEYGAVGEGSRRPEWSARPLRRGPRASGG